MTNVLLLIPKCMCKKECSLNKRIGTSGYSCKSNKDKCLDCQVYELKKLCDLHNIQYRIAGSKSVEKIIEEYKPDVVLGVACEKELIKFNDVLDYSFVINGNKKCENKCDKSDMDLTEIKNFIEGINNGL